MSKEYSTVVRLTLDRPIEEVGRRDLRKYIATAVKKWGKKYPTGDTPCSSIIEVEVGNFKDLDLSAARSHGGYARAESLTPAERSEAASKAARARWDKEKDKKP